MDAKTVVDKYRAEQQRDFAIAMTALRMMQEHYGNPYFSLHRTCTSAETEEWMGKARIEVDAGRARL